jgi:outer membrane protein OmpU
MKKVLFATSALVASAGFAAADVSLSGSAEMGIVGGDRYDQTQFWTHVDVNFSLSGTTDNGLTFGASVDLDEADNINGDGNDGVAVFISGGFGTLTMGDTDGGFDGGMSEVPTGSGSINDSETWHAGFNGNGGLDGTYNDDQILTYSHSVGALGFAVSIELDDTAGVNDDPVIGLGLRYSMGDLGIGLGYQSTGTAAGVDTEIMGVSLSYAMGDMAMGLNYSALSTDGWTEDQVHVGVGVSYSMDAITVGVNWGQTDGIGGDAVAESDGFGLSAGYNLGGGASILVGYGSQSVTTSGGVTTDTDSWSLGVSMSF